MDDRERESEIGWEGSSWDERERVSDRMKGES